ncbi:MAG TPA: nitroreductase family deazaflavin-dependent oxidoreductase [Mycobacterium sp.]|nr:nitroreductase family deazaflavin-dependent oxidoreductase [Mycobacterium sp.]
MSAKDRTNSAPGVPVVFPPWLERIQIRYMNPAIRRIAPYLPSFAIVKHRGRTSGREYETVVNAYRKGNLLAIMLAHGKTDWVKNVLAAGQADVHISGRDVHITNPRVLPTGSDTEGLPWVVQQGSRRMGVFVADLAG